MSNQNLIDAGDDPKIADGYTRRICIDLGNEDDDTNLVDAGDVPPIQKAFRPGLGISRPFTVVPPNPKSSIQLILECDSTIVAGDLTGIDASVKVDSLVALPDSAGKIATVRCPAEHLPAIRDLESVLYIRVPPPVELCLNVSTGPVDGINTQSLWSAPPPAYGTSDLVGSNIYVGIIDTGIDPTHLDFRDPTTQVTRIVEAWDMSQSGTPPSGFSYGKVITAADITTQLTGGAATGLTDTVGHGTTLATIVAGNGAATGGGQPAYQYIGVAPKASLIIVKLPTDPTEADIINACFYIFAKATAASKKCVILTAVRSRSGPRDGSGTLEYALSSMTGAGKIIVTAAGNDGMQLTPFASGTKKFVKGNLPAVGNTIDIPIFGGAHSTATAYEYLHMEFWVGQFDEFEITYNDLGRSPGTVTVPFNTDVVSYPLARNVMVTIKNSTIISYKLRRKIDVFIDNSGNLAENALNYQAVITLKRTGTGGTGDFYGAMVDSYYSNPPTRDPYAFQQTNLAPASCVTVDYTLCSPATGDNILSAGAHQIKKTYDAIGGTGQVAGGTSGVIPTWSGRGPRPFVTDVSPNFYPTCVAPGEAIAVARSAQRVPNDSNFDALLDQKHVVRYGSITSASQGKVLQGTSLAAAHLAGFVACALGVTNYTPAQIRTLLTSNCGGTLLNNPNQNVKGMGRLYQLSLRSGVGIDPNPIPAPPRQGSVDDPMTDPPIKRPVLGRMTVAETPVKQFNVDVGGFTIVTDAITEAEDGTDITVQIWDRNMTPIRTLVTQKGVVGGLFWDFRDEDGFAVNQGTYNLRITVDGDVTIGQLDISLVQ